MNNTSLILESAIAGRMKKMAEISKEATGIDRAYFATDASGLVDALASASTPATVSTKLTKGQFQNMIGCLQQVEKFFGNQAVTQGDYLNSLENVQNGSAILVNPLSQNVESLGSRIKAIAMGMLFEFGEAVEIVKVYNISGIGSAVSAISASTIVFGSSTSAAKFLSGIVLLEQFKKMLGNLAVTQGDYQATVADWTSGEE